jgi:hypothetical protein
MSTVEELCINSLGQTETLQCFVELEVVCVSHRNIAQDLTVVNVFEEVVLPNKQNDNCELEVSKCLLIVSD